MDLEISLGLNENALKSGKIVRIDINDPFTKNLRLPEEGNKFFRPGEGITTGGINQGIIDAPKIGTKGVRKQTVWGW